jgi:hypothetical protein
MIMKRTIILIALTSMLAVACHKDDSIGGTVNSTDAMDLTTFEWMSQTDETAVVAQLFEMAGMVDDINGEVTIVGPSKWSVQRYIRRRNKPYRDGVAGATEFKLEDLTPAELAQMGMYVFPGKWDSKALAEQGAQYLTSLDGSQEIYLSLEKASADPGAAWNGEGNPGVGYQYGNFMMSNPMLVYVVFKRGVNWEVDDKTGLPSYYARYTLGLTSAETDQAYRMYLSDVRTKNGIVHIVVMGNTAYAERYHYHTLFFYGTRNDDY